jgi:antitoxin component YwqK of YwqJK toxin-antitoxin module
MRKRSFLAAAIILGTANSVIWEKAWVSDSDFAVDQADRELAFSELVLRDGVAYAAPAGSRSIEDELFTGRGFQLYEKGQIRLSGEFVGGLPDGKWELWHDNQSPWFASLLRADGFYPEKDGCTFLVNSQGQICLDNFRNLTFEGLTRTWYENGQLKLEATYQDGERQGLTGTWYENGQLEFAATYKAGELEGLTRKWYENGQLACQATFKAGEAEGLTRTWYENGQLKSQATYKAGEAEGLFRVWHENGLASEAIFRAGEEITYEAAIELYTAPAKQGDPEAQWLLGLAYANASPPLQNHEKAEEWTLRSAENGYVNAMVDLGKFYLFYVDPPNEQAAMQWYARAADHGEPEAQLMMGLNQLSTEGPLPQNRIEAWKWLILSAEQGHPLAHVTMSRLRSDFTEEQIAEATRRAATWKPVK